MVYAQSNPPGSTMTYWMLWPERPMMPLHPLPLGIKMKCHAAWLFAKYANDQ